ncbi:MAG TPA: pyridoxamine 5'-phosphate oxidase [Candidatus Baltobacteraceae bacterium]|nr:pyridoxamine 5'-phosphate oxidase [Candidatus Baltobacteraceae bacterium]
MKEPLAQLARWIDEAGGMERLDAVTMCLATVDARARPSARLVLLRGLDDRGLRFFTSYLSRKAREIAENPHAAAVLYWPAFGRQVRIEGEVAPLGEDESDAYFDARPRGHQLAAWASEQSEPIENYEMLAERFNAFEQRFEDESIPRPHSWGGYLLAPSRIEFWQSRPNRLHERTLFTRQTAAWEKQLLQP